MRAALPDAMREDRGTKLLLIPRLELATMTTVCPIWTVAGKKTKKSLDICFGVIVNYNSIDEGIR